MRSIILKEMEKRNAKENEVEQMGIYSDCPCRGCETPKRHELCHSHCPEKLAWDEKHRDIKQKIFEEKSRDYVANKYTIDSVRRIAKYTKKKGYKGK